MLGPRLRSKGVVTLILTILFILPKISLGTPYEKAILQALDKITARVFTIEAKLGEIIKFGTLEIIVRHCDKRPPEETPESAAYLETIDIRPSGARFKMFQGWMFASSPALSALEHPIYDVWVGDCI